MDDREKLYNLIAIDLAKNNIASEELENIMNVIAINLDKFEVQVRCTELSTVAHDSREIIYMYLCALLSEGKSKRTIKEYGNVYNMFLLETNRELREVTTFEIRAWLAKIQMRASKRTAENYRSYLSSLFNWCMLEEIINKNPMDKIKPVKFEQKKREYFSSVEIDAIRCGTSNNIMHRALIEVLLSSGIRIDELCNLKISDVDFLEKTISINCGKGSKYRTTIMSQLASSYLQKYLNSRKDNLDWLFVTTKKPYNKTSSDNIRKILKRIQKNTNIENIHPHKFRRTFASNCAEKGVPIEVIQELLGHANINTTRLYVVVSHVSKMKLNDYY